MHANWNLILFYVLAGVAVISALMVVLQNNPVRCVLFLVLTFFASAGLWLLQDAEFLSLILLLVYVGAVMTLFLFVVMMLNIDVESGKIKFARYIPFGLILVALVIGLFMIAVPGSLFKQQASNERLTPTSGAQSLQAIHNLTPHEENFTEHSNTVEIGEVLYTDYVLAFEVAAVILLVAIVAAITLVHQMRSGSKRQDIRRQITTNRDDRLTIVAMKSENRIGSDL